jgi:hypothetical protein
VCAADYHDACWSMSARCLVPGCVAPPRRQGQRVRWDSRTGAGAAICWAAVVASLLVYKLGGALGLPVEAFKIVPAFVALVLGIAAWFLTASLAIRAIGSPDGMRNYYGWRAMQTIAWTVAAGVPTCGIGIGGLIAVVGYPFAVACAGIGLCIDSDRSTAVRALGVIAGVTVGVPGGIIALVLLLD